MLRRDIGWFFIGATLFVSNISTEHFTGLSGPNQEQVKSRTYLGLHRSQAGNLGTRYAF
jgi:hypothetical protein